MLRCPVCDIPLCVMRYEHVLVRFCPDCRGMLVEEPRLAVIKKRRGHTWSTDAKRRIWRQVLRAEEQTEVRCPRCLMPMDTTRLETPDGSFCLDRCDRCHLIWFDAGELEAVQIQYEKRLDGRTPEAWDRIERLAVSQIEHRRQTEAALQGAGDPTSVEGAVVGVGGGLWWSPQIAAGQAAAWAVMNLTEAMAEEKASAERRRLFLKAAVGFLTAGGILAAYLWWRSK